MNWTTRRQNRIHFRIAKTIGICLLLALLQLSNAAELRREGRALMWGDRPIHLIGYSYYGLLGDRQFDAAAFLENLAAHNINFTRFFLILPWPVAPGPNVLPYRKADGKYDLRQFNDEFFVRLRSIVKRAEELGIICQVCFFDRCGLSVTDGRAWPNNPYNAECNINGLLKGPKVGYPPFCRPQGPIADVNAAFIRQVVKTIGDYRNVLYEIINEPYRQLGPLPEWHAWAARELRKNLAGRSGSKVISSCGAYDDDEIDVFSMHIAGSERHVTSAIHQSKALNKPVILSDDGDQRCMFNPDVTRSAAERAIRLGQHFEHLEFTLTLRREGEKRRAASLHEMPGLCQLNLRALADLSTPILMRPFVRRASLRRAKTGYVLSAQIERAEMARRVIGELSEDGGRTWSNVPLTVDPGSVTSDPVPGRDGARSLLRVVCIDGRSRRWPGPAYAFGPADRWTVQLGDEVIEAGLILVRPYTPDGVIHAARRGGRACYEADLSRRSRYVYFRLENSFPRGSVAGAVTIRIDYFDQPAGAELLLEYDGAQDRYADADPVLLKGSGTWKSASFTVRDGIFGGRQNDGADFRFSLTDSVAPLALRSVRVERSEDPR